MGRAARAAAVVAASLLAGRLLAAEVKLGPEFALGERIPRPAPFSIPMAVASNGNDYLVAWENRPADVVVTRIGRDGIAVDPIQRLIGYGYDPMLTRYGNGYLLAWMSDATGVNIQRLDETGAPLGQVWIIPSRGLLALVSNGSTALLVGYFPYATRGFILDGDGKPGEMLDVDFSGMKGVGVHDGRYIAFLSSHGALTLRTIAEDGSTSDVKLPAGSVDSEATPTFTADRILFMPRFTRAYAVTDYEGNVIKSSTEVQTTGGMLYAGWDGREFLLVFGNGQAVRLTSDGSPLDPSPFKLFEQDFADIGFAFSETGLFAISAFRSPSRAYGRVAPDFDAFAATHDPGILLEAPTEQLSGGIARSPGGVFAAWMDSAGSAVRASFNGRPILVDTAVDYRTVGWPVVAAGRNVFLVVWWRRGPDNEYRGFLFARRYDFAGRPLDSQPIALGAAYRRFPPAIAFDGTTFLIAWNRYDYYSFVTARIGETGELFGEAPIPQPPHISPAAPDIVSVSPLWTGTEFLLTYTYNDYGSGEDWYRIGVAHVDRSNGVSTVSRSASFDFARITTSRINSTVVNGRVTYAWGNPSLTIAQTALDGKLIRGPERPADQIPAPVATGRHPPDPTQPWFAGDAQIVWNGGEYVLTWMSTPWESERHVWAVRLDAELNLLDAAAIDVSGPRAYSDFSLIRSADGVIIAYSRIDGPSPLFFFRTLDRIGLPTTRRKAAGR